MADLRVDYPVLDGIARSLAQVADEFEGMHKQRDIEAHIWGGRQIRGAMDDFASNWDRHRETLTESIRDLGEKCAAVADTFQAGEQALGTAFAGPPP